LTLVGQRKWLKDNSLHSKSASITLLASLNENEPVFFDFRNQSNTQYDHLDFIFAAVVHGALKPGDIFVVDNATIHGGSETLPHIYNLLKAHNIQLVYLPTYSPELNPCELAFNVIKNYLRNHRDNSIPLCQNVVQAVAQISIGKMYKFYKHCLCLKNIKKKINYLC